MAAPARGSDDGRRRARAATRSPRRRSAATSTPTEGRARVIELRDGRRYVRFEDFRTSNGPLLRVYLSATAPDGRGAAPSI